jgi:cob(I)alamin adenosyltransferase
MGLFYTSKGDKGISDLGRKKIKKTALEIEAVGALDELNSLLGVVKNQSFGKLNNLFRKILNEVQEDLFIIQAHIGAVMVKNEFKPPLFTKNKIIKLEKLIDDFEKKIKPQRGFIVYGATKQTGWLDYARAVSRRAERRVLKLENKLQPEIFAYLNRLSSLLYAMARFSAKQRKKKEKKPLYK